MHRETLYLHEIIPGYYSYLNQSPKPWHYRFQTKHHYLTKKKKRRYKKKNKMNVTDNKNMFD